MSTESQSQPPSKLVVSSDVRPEPSCDSDDGLLLQLGYKQEFRREFTRWSTLSYAISILGVLGSVPATWGTPLISGGPATAIWTWFAGSFFALCLALSIAELISAYPTAGGMYYVTKHVFPPEKVPLAAWVIGWSNFLGQAGGVASVAYSVSQMTLAAVSMGSVQDDGMFSYSPTPQITVGLSIAVLICHGILCSFPSRTLSKMIRWFAPINIIGSVVVSIALLILSPNKPPASEVFGTITDGSGWNNHGFSFLIGFLSVAWVMTDYDGVGHVSEELHNASTSAPAALIVGIVVTWVSGWLLNVALGFGTGDMEGILSSPMGNPAAQVFFNAGGRNGGIAMWFWVILVQFFTGMSAMLANTRTCFALARDEAFPFSGTLRKMNSHTQTPLYSVWAVVVFCCLMNLIGLGSAQTINGIFGITAPAMDLSYIAVIAARLYYAKSHPVTPGPFRLGRLQKPVNVIAIVWTLFISVILFFPPTYPVTPENMNYAIAIAGAVALLSLSWWYAGARRYYVGPRTENY
ncbi:amino acid permease, variant [Thozetella sp. PMI_491]|nr:amino acid permease, variant [Thozetella sp. PMI_491]